MLDQFSNTRLINDIAEKSRELQMIYEETNFYPKDLLEVAEDLSGDVMILIDVLEDL
ncbi:hypothetical protein [Virgibacillus dokdonensis]|uniref:hypothetical protein n=1 Tax=Virgibacillus dokdonensis TaxID=302167 RepID=UPI0015F2809C|nr:hypothetical protein [Virgibacillus dokdonensis]